KDCFRSSEREPCTHLKLAARCHRHRDGPELWSIDEAVRCTQVGLVERVEGFGAELEPGFLSETKGTCQREVQALLWWTKNGIPASIAIGKGRRRNESRRV